MNMGQGIAMFGQSIGDAIRRSREKEKKKKEKEEMRQALLKFGVPESMADMIGGDSELFKNFSQLKQLQLAEEKNRIAREQIQKANEPTPEQTRILKQQENIGNTALSVLSDPKKAKTTYGVYADNWKGGTAQDAYAFHTMFGNKKQPDAKTKSTLNAFSEIPGTSLEGLIANDPEQVMKWGQAGGTINELTPFQRLHKQSEEEEDFQGGAFAVPLPGGEGNVTALKTSPNSVQYMIPKTTGDIKPTATIQNNEYIRDLINNGDVQGLTTILAQQGLLQPYDARGLTSTAPEILDLIDQAEQNAKRKQKK